MFPNPATDQFTISGPADKFIKSISILDLSGRMVMRKTIERSNPALTVSSGELSPGIYFVRVEEESGYSVIKLIRN